MTTIFHVGGKVQGMSKTEAAVLEFFGKEFEHRAAPVAKLQFFYEIIKEVDADPKEVIGALRTLRDLDLVKEYGREDKEHKLMYEITDAGLAVNAKVRQELKDRADARANLKKELKGALRSIVVHHP